MPGALSVLQQRDSFLTSLGGGSADADALFVVWAGANNLADIVETAATNPNLTADLAKAVNDIGDIIISLAGKGARNILVPNLPDFGALPLLPAVADQCRAPHS